VAKNVKLKQLEEELKEKWSGEYEDIPCENRPTILYHYTTVEGLKGIISSSCMWATSIRYLNDSSELLYASDLVSAILESKKEEYNSAKSLIGDGKNMVDRFADKFDAYVTCFCEKDNLLSQWRAYAAGRSGGYSIGLEAKYIENRSSNLKFSLRKVEYNRKVQENYVTSLVDRVCTLFE